MKMIEYRIEMGEVSYPDGFLELIKDMPIESQSKYFRTTLKSFYTKTDWTERMLEGTRALEDDSDVKALIIKDGYIVGAMIEEWFSKKEIPVLLDKSICTYYTSENNGSGYNEREDYTYFVCVFKCI